MGTLTPNAQRALEHIGSAIHEYGSAELKEVLASDSGVIAFSLYFTFAMMHETGMSMADAIVAAGQLVVAEAQS